MRQAGRAFRSPYTACRCIGACSRFGKRPKADFRRVATGIAVTEKMFQVLHTLPLKCFQVSSWTSARFLAKPRLSMAVLRFKVAFYLNHAVFFNAVEGPPFCVLARRALFARRAVAVLQHRVAVATINLRGLQERMVVYRRVSVQSTFLSRMRLAGFPRARLQSICAGMTQDELRNV